jgi:hypothetical protein
MKRMMALAATLVVGLVLAFVSTRTPATPAHPAPGDFQASRAMADIEVIAQRGHPIGSADHARVRDYLLGRLRQLGLEVRVQSGEGVFSIARHDRATVSGGQVDNLIGVMAGKDRALPPLVIQAHYDSVPNSPGAADDSTGVGVALDIARALKAQGQPARDVVFLITDGEESGLLGAQSFYASDPLARRIGLVINMEARGGGGRVWMFETSNSNGGLVDAYRKVTRDPASTSLAIYIYQHMPNDTDLTVVKKSHIAGLNYAFIGKEFDYHAGSSTPANLERGTVQHMGQQVLATAQAFAFSTALPKARPDVVYSDVLGQAIVGYPQWAGWLVLLAGAGMAVAALARARRAEPLSWVVALRAVGALVLAVVVAGALAYGARALTGSPINFTGQRPMLAQFGRFEASVFALSLSSLLLAFAGLAGRNPRPWSAWAGVLGLGFILAAALQALAAPTAFLLAWPLVVAAVIALVAAYAGKGTFEAPASLAAVVVLGGLGLAQVLGMAHFVALGVGADLPSALAVFALVAALILTPWLWSRTRGQVIGGALAVVVGLGLVLAVRLTDPSSPRHPRATEVYYLADADSGAFWRVSAMPDADAWTRAVLTADGGKAVERAIRGFGEKLLVAPAKPIAVARPQATMSTDAKGRTTVRVVEAADSRQVRFSVRSDKPITAATTNGKRVAMTAKTLSVYWTSPGRPIELVLDTAPGARLDVKVAEVRDGWPKDAKPLPPRPADAMAWGDSDVTVSLATPAVEGGPAAAR